MRRTYPTTVLFFLPSNGFSVALETFVHYGALIFMIFVFAILFLLMALDLKAANGSYSFIGSVLYHVNDLRVNWFFIKAFRNSSTRSALSKGVLIIAEV